MYIFELIELSGVDATFLIWLLSLSGDKPIWPGSAEPWRRELKARPVRTAADTGRTVLPSVKAATTSRSWTAADGTDGPFFYAKESKSHDRAGRPSPARRSELARSPGRVRLSMFAEREPAPSRVQRVPNRLRRVQIASTQIERA